MGTHDLHPRLVRVRPDNSSDVVGVIEATMRVEIPQRDRVKYEYRDDPETGGERLFVDRVLHTPMAYPFNYGDLLYTLSGDGDPLDVVLLGSASMVPGAHVRCRLIGALVTEDEKGRDEKIIAVPVPSVDPRLEHLLDVRQVERPTLREISFFFKNYKSLEKNKFVTISAEPFVGRDATTAIFRECLTAHNALNETVPLVEEDVVVDGARPSGEPTKEQSAHKRAV